MVRRGTSRHVNEEKVSGSGLDGFMATHLLPYGPEDAVPCRIEMFDSNFITEPEQGRARLAIPDGFQRTDLRQACATSALVFVRHGAQSDDAARLHGARLRGMGDQVAIGKGCIDASVEVAH